MKINPTLESINRLETLNIPFQRIGATSNADVGRNFEGLIYDFFLMQNIELEFNFKLLVGVDQSKKFHAFDLGSETEKIIVECKSHRWTEGRNIPSAKLTVWNEAMYYFHLAPNDYRKIMFVLKDVCQKRGISLAEYYIKTHGHLIPRSVEIWEFDDLSKMAVKIYPR